MVAIAIAVYVPLIYLGLKGYRKLKAAAESAANRTFDGVYLLQTPAPGMVEVVFHIYYGMIAVTWQVEYRFWAKPVDAMRVLSRLHRFNCTWGFFAYGGLLIPILSWANYRSQLRSVKKQERSAAQS
jgi:hypothetical protein